MDVNGDHVSAGMWSALVGLIAGLLGWRGFNKVRTDNARENRESRFEDAVQKRLDAALIRIDTLSAELAKARDGSAIREREVRDLKQKVRNLLDTLAAADRAAVARWVRESGFAPFEE